MGDKNVFRNFVPAPRLPQGFYQVDYETYTAAKDTNPSSEREQTLSEPELPAYESH